MNICKLCASFPTTCFAKRMRPLRLKYFNSISGLKLISKKGIDLGIWFIHANQFLQTVRFNESVWIQQFICINTQEYSRTFYILKCFYKNTSQFVSKWNLNAFWVIAKTFKSFNCCSYKNLFHSAYLHQNIIVTAVTVIKQILT